MVERATAETAVARRKGEVRIDVDYVNSDGLAFY